MKLGPGAEHMRSTTFCPTVWKTFVWISSKTIYIYKTLQNLCRRFFSM